MIWNCDSFSGALAFCRSLTVAALKVGVRVRQENEFKNSEVMLADSVCEIEVEIMNADGLHMRPAMQFVDVASKYKCDIQVSNTETRVDAKSIMQMTMLAATCGTKLMVRAEGEDCKEAIDALRDLVEVRLFGEPPKEQVS